MEIWKTITDSPNYEVSNLGNIRKIRDNKGMAQTNSKLSDDDIKFIRANFKKCDPVYGGIPLAKRFGVYKSTIYKIVQGRAWKHI
ncbi:HNH endonuclease [Klebsiella phage fENko-Kae01]|nr:hypothetical protein [Klebsiella phage fENko-Kae01]WNV47660.1 HNH endonuclease [Klebsiella phage fENko-Kae01]